LRLDRPHRRRPAGPMALLLGSDKRPTTW